MTRPSIMTLTILLSVFCSLPAVGAEPVASADSNWDDVEVHLMSVERKGSVMTVKWAAVNNGAEDQKVYFAYKGRDSCYAIDEENGTKYYALTDQEGNPIASANDYINPNSTGSNVKIGPGKTKRFWMKMPAPPPEVTKIGIFLNEVEPFDGITIVDR